MSERLERSREQRSSLLRDVADDALMGLDAAVPDAALAVVGAAGCSRFVEKIAERAVEALDGDDVLFVAWQNRRFLEASSRSSSTVEEALRRALTDYLKWELGSHLDGRAAQFRAGNEDGIAA